MVEKPDIMSEILHKLYPLDQIRDPKNCDIMHILLSMFFINPHNYYNDYKSKFITALFMFMPFACLTVHLKLQEKMGKK